MTPPKIRKADIPPVKSGDCSQDPEIPDNHFQVLVGLSSQLEQIVTGMNNYIDHTQEWMDRVCKKLDGIKDTQKQHGEKLEEGQGMFSTVDKGISFLKRDIADNVQEIERVSNKVRKLRDDKNGEIRGQLKEEKEKRMLVIRPLTAWAIAFFMAMFLLGFSNWTKQSSADFTDAQLKSVIEQTLKEVGK